LSSYWQLHVLVIDSSGGSPGIRDLARLESAIAYQRQEVFGEVLYKDIWEKLLLFPRYIADHAL